MNRAGEGANPALLALEKFQFDFDGGALAGRIGVAYSGGADSTALLLAAAAHWPGHVSAIHIHHGLQAAAESFAETCTAVCEQLAVPLRIVRVDAAPASGQSPEDAARLARYGALARAASTDGLQAVLLGQHADDQVETLLLALSRGAGLPGLAAMAASFDRAGTRFLRPLLQTPAPDLRAWLLAQGIPYVDDPTNADERFTRNRIRARLMPELDAAFPQFRETFSRSARHAADAQALLAEVAEDDLRTTGSPPALRALQALSPRRRGNVLRHWLMQSYSVAPSAAQLAQLLSQIAACTTRGHNIHLKVADGHVVRDGEVIRYAPVTGAAGKTD